MYPPDRLDSSETKRSFHSNPESKRSGGYIETYPQIAWIQGLSGKIAWFQMKPSDLGGTSKRTP